MEEGRQEKCLSQKAITLVASRNSPSMCSEGIVTLLYFWTNDKLTEHKAVSFFFFSKFSENNFIAVNLALLAFLKGSL